MKYRERRRPSQREGELIGRAERHRVRIVDVSGGGMKVACSRSTFVTGQRVTVSSGRIETSGVIVWTDGDRHGIAFDRPLDARDVTEFAGGPATTPGRRPHATMHGFAEL